MTSVVIPLWPSHVVISKDHALTFRSVHVCISFIIVYDDQPVDI